MNVVLYNVFILIRDEDLDAHTHNLMHQSPTREHEALCADTSVYTHTHTLK